LKTVYFDTLDHASFTFEIQELSNPAISNYTAFQLLDSGEGQATCLLCRKTYGADQLIRFRMQRSKDMTLWIVRVLISEKVTS
jgi:hypothetical protein